MNVTSIINREKRKRQEETSHVIKKKFKHWNMLNSLEVNTQNGIASTSFRTKKIHTDEYTQEVVANVANVASNHCAKYNEQIALDEANTNGMCEYTQDGTALVPLCNNPDLSWAHPNESQFYLDGAMGGGQEDYRQHEEGEKQGWENGFNTNGVNKLKRTRGKKPTRGEIKGNEKSKKKKKKRENGVNASDSGCSGSNGGSSKDGIRSRGRTTNRRNGSNGRYRSNWSNQSSCYCSPPSSSCSSSCCGDRSSDFSESRGSYGSSSLASNRGRNHNRQNTSEGKHKPSNGDSIWEGLLKKDVILLVIQAIKNMGYKKSAKHLELESGIELEQPIVKEMHKNVLAGKWKNAIRNLRSLRVHKKIIKAISFLLYEQCFIEYLYEGKHFAALRCLRNRLAKFCFDEDTYNRLHECTTFFMSMNSPYLTKRRKENYQAKVKHSRKLLFEKMNRLLPEHVILPPRRLAILLHQSLKYQVDNCLFHNNFSEAKLINALLQGKKGREDLDAAIEASASNTVNAANGVNVSDVMDSAGPNANTQKMPRMKPTTSHSAACQAKTFEFKKQKKSDENRQVDRDTNSCLNKKKNIIQEDEMNFSVSDFSRYHQNVRGECSSYYHKGSPCEVTSNEALQDQAMLNDTLLNETVLNQPPPDEPDNHMNTTTHLWDDDLVGENQFNVNSGQPVRKGTKLKCALRPREATRARFAPGENAHASQTGGSKGSTGSSDDVSGNVIANASANSTANSTLLGNPFPCLMGGIIKSAKSTAGKKYAKICTLNGATSEAPKGEVTLGKIPKKTKTPNELIIAKEKMQKGSSISGAKNVINSKDGFVTTQERELLISHDGGNETDGTTRKEEELPLKVCNGAEGTLHSQEGEDNRNMRPEWKHHEREVREEGSKQFTRQDRTHGSICEGAGRKTFTLSLLRNHQCKKIKLPYYCIKILQGHKDEVWYVDVSKNGKYIASASKDKSIILWKGLYPFNKIREWNGHVDGVSYVIWSHNSKYLVSGSNDSNIIIWSPKSNKKKLSLTMHNGPITSIYWSKDDTTIISSAFDKKIYCTKLNEELKGFSVLYAWSFSTRIQNFVFTNNEKYLIAVPSDKNVRVIDFAIKKELYILPEYDTITSVCASSLYNHILVNIADQRPTVKLWDVKHRYIIQTYRGHKQGRFIVHSTFGGKKEDYVISGSEDSLIYIWHKTKGFLLDVINGHASTVSIAIWPLASSKFPYMVSASDDHTIMVWNVHPKAATIRRDSRRRRKKFVHPFLRELTKFRPVAG
ncbi:hypothetical protein C922_01328 [Plasmodium inui San Antonio 1]|uniref:CTLH domain-containing protein n=1 Tax=Plasmodium inui San Antonio 1 TaxID=1237626 RepID=W7AAK3_9APIC|nr:hypothetical protein C922_01328 [Plasmodium inui San Antonio 1]EUD68308.1 hypothetical protein C922_01328 [Plasmodium inui San Antonio 1]